MKTTNQRVSIDLGKRKTLTMKIKINSKKMKIVFCLTYKI